MNKRISLGSAITFILIAATITFCLTMVFSTNLFNKKVNSLKDREMMYEKIAEIDSVVRGKYNDKIDATSLFEGLAKGYFMGLEDKYSYYMTKDEYTEYLKESSSDYVGIGITAFKESSGYIKIADVQSGSPGEKAGLLKNDLIIAVNSINSTKDNADSLIKSLKDKPGITVEITYRRNGIDQTVQIVRKQYEIKTILSEKINNTGYIKIIEFSDNTPNQFKLAIDDLKSKGVNSLIFDVRNTSVGSLDSASKCLDYIIPEGPIVVAEFNTGKTEVKTKSVVGEITLPMITLTNNNTAGAAELFTVTLKDYGKAKQVGSTTAGKGIIQEVVKLQDGSAVNLTIAKLKPVKSKDFNEIGLSPDFIQLITEEQYNSINDMTIETDPQLKKAFDVLSSILKPVESSQPYISDSTSQTESLPKDNESADETTSISPTE